MKPCSTCGEVKPLGEFSPLKRGLHGRKAACKPCSAMQSRKRRANETTEQRERRQAKNRARMNRRYAAMRDEINAQRRQDYDPEKAHDYHLRAKYGITLADFERMNDAVGSACEICGEACQSGRRLAVDHDHVTGAVRGLLCGNCNRGLGMFRDRPELLVAAAEYLGERAEPSQQ